MTSQKTLSVEEKKEKKDEEKKEKKKEDERGEMDGWKDREIKRKG